MFLGTREIFLRFAGQGRTAIVDQGGAASCTARISSLSVLMQALPYLNYVRLFRLGFDGIGSYASTSLVWIMRNTCLPLMNSSTPVIESNAGMPVRSGSNGGFAVALVGGRTPVFFLRFDRDIVSSVHCFLACFT
jgi:hypothetical protein